MTAGRHAAPRWHRRLRAEWYSLRADFGDLNMAYRQSLRQRDPAPLLACRDLMLRARPATGDAHPDGTAAAPAAAAVPLTLDDFWEWRQRGLPDASGREPGACLTSIDPGIHAYLRARLGAETRRLP